MKVDRKLFANELLIHPGQTLYEVICDKNISQEELAIKTGYSKEELIDIINGKKDISLNLAKMLEEVLGICRSFWTNLQANYNNERDRLIG